MPYPGRNRFARRIEVSEVVWDPPHFLDPGQNGYSPRIVYPNEDCVIVTPCDRLFSHMENPSAWNLDDPHGASWTRGGLAQPNDWLRLAVATLFLWEPNHVCDESNPSASA